jgi:hypothetical protein
MTDSVSSKRARSRRISTVPTGSRLGGLGNGDRALGTRHERRAGPGNAKPFPALTVPAPRWLYVLTNSKSGTPSGSPVSIVGLFVP